MKSLIICPVGCPITFDDRYNKKEHWRFTNVAEREYTTLAVIYNNDFSPEPHSYDFSLRASGHKWQLIKQMAKIVDLSVYDYIGCVDDDLITDIDSFNYGIRLAREHDFKFWQLSMIEGSGIIYDCLKQRPQWNYSETTFIEMGSPFFRLDKFQHLCNFMSQFDFEVGWGLDKVFCDVLRSRPNVVHKKSIYHPPNEIKPSYYNQARAMLEMQNMITSVYPKAMKEIGIDNWSLNDVQTTLKSW